MGTYPTGTHAFEPDLLNPSRIPLRVDAHDFRPCISDHFKEILFQTPAAKSQIRSVAKSDFLTLARRCGKHKLGTEASVRELSREISGVVDSIYFDLTQKSLETSTEPSEEGKQVRTDRVYSCLDKVLLLWDEKSPAAFNHHVSSLQVHLPLKFNIFQGRWENEEAILAKIVWHSSSLDEKPRWAILFGGEDYLLILIVYVKDSHGLDRPFLFCSPIHSIYDAGLPIFSVSIYMALTANIPEDGLLQKLGIQRPTAPEPVLDPLPKTYAEATTTQISKLDVLHLVLDEPVSYRKLVRIEQALTEPDGEGQKPRMNYAIFLDSKCERMEGSTGTTYISKCRSFAVKLSHQTRNARKALTDEWETYIKLKTQKGQATMYGLFEIDAGTTEDGKRKEGLRYVLVMSYEGESPCSFSVLSDAERRQIFSKLKQYHADGLLHGDFAPRNVVCKRGGTPVIIDFSHSSWDHMCRGEFSCGELLEARKQLWGSTPGDPPSPPPPQSVMRHLGNNEPQSLVFQKI
ncbi:hypothetical protein FRC20_011785 [Serendipita sp. 405]|nr:hypothetical protein FRC20_011785 [Serendipita sp. 405]